MKYSQILIDAFFLLLAAGCANGRQGVAPTALITRTAIASQTPVASQTPAATPVPATRTLTSAPAASETPTPTPAVLIGAGDIAYCGADNLGDEQTADLIGRLLQRYPQAQLFAAGDTVQGDGLDWEYRDCFGPSWGRFLERLHPVPGNHEYQTAGGAPYFQYFGARAGRPGEGFYSFDLGDWHIVALNSNCNDVACGTASPQAAWLRADLAASAKACTLLYWHHPRWSSGLAGGTGIPAVFWQIASAAGAEIVVSGHDHDYERFAALDAAGQPAENGIRSFVVGTGGAALRAWGTPAAHSAARQNDTWGVIVFRLYPGHYEWEFAPVAGGTFSDAGQGTCD